MKDRIPKIYSPLPCDLLPGPLREYVITASEVLRCDPVGPAMSCLAGCAASIGNARNLEVKPNTDYRPANLWFCLISGSGSRKTAQIKMPLEPFHKMQVASYEQYKQDKQQYEQDKRAAQRDGLDYPDPPTYKRFTVDDITIEGLCSALAQTPRGLLCGKDELAGWVKGFDKYRSGGGDVEQWLTIYDAGTVQVDRKGTDPIVIPRAFVSIIGGIQPAVFRRCFDGEFMENGLLARFMVAAPPRQSSRHTEAQLPQETIDALADTYTALRSMQPRENGEPVPLQIGCGEARERWIEFVNTHADAGEQLDGFDLAVHEKVEGHASRLALVIHCIRLVTDEKTPASVDVESLDAGIGLALWFYQQMQSQHQTPEQTLMKVVKDNRYRITPQDLVRHHAYKTAGDAERALNQLEQQGLLERNTDQIGRGRPATTYIATTEGIALCDKSINPEKNGFIT